jgi:hypothetical protein
MLARQRVLHHLLLSLNGASAGKFLEIIVEREFLAPSFLSRTANDDGGNLDIFAPRVLVENMRDIALRLRELERSAGKIEKQSHAIRYFSRCVAY